MSFDVTSLVTGTGLVSFALDTTSSTSKSLPSREATANQPQLVVETGRRHHHVTATRPDPSGSVVIAVGGDVACGTTEANYNGGARDRHRLPHEADVRPCSARWRRSEVWALGDLQYNSGAPGDFTVSYENSWGRFKNITNPVVGNHEYGTSGAGGYFTYFGSAASPRQPAAPGTARATTAST